MTMTDADMVAGVARATRRIFTREYKLRVLSEYEAAVERGARGALLRREGLFQSHIGKWSRARDAGRLSAASGPDREVSAGVSENASLRGEVDRLTKELTATKAVLDVVGKVHVLLEVLSESTGTAPR
jgi:transposase